MSFIVKRNAFLDNPTILIFLLVILHETDIYLAFYYENLCSYEHDP